MTPEQGLLFLQALNVKNVSGHSGHWIQGSCPLAPWLHQSQKDSNPSFGLWVNPTEPARFHCFGCTSGSAAELIARLDLYSRDTHFRQLFKFAEAYKVLAGEEISLPTLGEFQEFGSVQDAPVFTEWPYYWLSSFMTAGHSPAAVDYLTGRRVSMTTALKHDLRYDFSRQMIVAPFYNAYGQLAGARGRTIHAGKEGKEKHFDYSWKGCNNTGLVWYNEEALQLPGPVVVVEGQFDVWRVAEAYPKVVGNLTSKPSIHKLAKLSQCDAVIHIPDRDKAGALSVERYEEYCSKFSIPYSHLELGDGVKDPDDCASDYLKDLISSAL